MHGGTIEAASGGEGSGSSFTVTLPRAMRRTAAGGPEDPARRRRRDQRRVPDLSGVRVLVVDDDADALEMVRDILESAGASVSSSDSAAQALLSLEQTCPDVLVADLGMPSMDGFELIVTVRRASNQQLRDLPAAALTAYARSEDRSRALRSGFNMHLAKPIDPVALIAAVVSLSGRG
jgi:CheY-like chemotaxis protein